MDPRINGVPFGLWRIFGAGRSSEYYILAILEEIADVTLD